MFKLVCKDLKIGRYPVLMAAAFWVYILFIKHGKGRAFIVVSLILSFQALVVDDQYRTETLFAGLPLKRSTIVLARYATALLSIVAVTVVTFLAGIALNHFFPGNYKDIIPFGELVGAQLIVLFFVVLEYPVHFRFEGQLEAGIKASAVLFTGMFLGAIGISALFSSLNIDPFEIKHLLLYITVLGILSLIGSILLSLRIYGKREIEGK
ncbi:MAG: ABC-2 transporter permease [bacterium]|nr:ABC-2 transporter permease [bacterium]